GRPPSPGVRAPARRSRRRPARARAPPRGRWPPRSAPAGRTGPRSPAATSPAAWRRATRRPPARPRPLPTIRTDACPWPWSHPGRKPPCSPEGRDGGNAAADGSGAVVPTAAPAARRLRRRALLRPFGGGVGMQGQRLDLAHQATHRGVDRLVPAHGRLAFEDLAGDDGLVVRLQPAAVHMAFVQHVEMAGGEGLEGGADAVELRVHARIIARPGAPRRTQCPAGVPAPCGPRSIPRWWAPPPPARGSRGWRSWPRGPGSRPRRAPRRGRRGLGTRARG